jgi:hypothetical protein
MWTADQLRVCVEGTRCDFLRAPAMSHTSWSLRCPKNLILGVTNWDRKLLCTSLVSNNIGQCLAIESGQNAEAPAALFC